MSERQAFALEAELELHEGTDPRAPGGAVTVALCGSWNHEGPCRWPHHSAIDGAAGSVRLRTVFAVVADDERDVRARIVAALGADTRWKVVGVSDVPLSADEAKLGRNLCGLPEGSEPGQL